MQNLSHGLFSWTTYLHRNSHPCYARGRPCLEVSKTSSGPTGLQQTWSRRNVLQGLDDLSLQGHGKRIKLSVIVWSTSTICKWKGIPNLWRDSVYPCLQTQWEQQRGFPSHQPSFRCWGPYIFLLTSLPLDAGDLTCLRIAGPFGLGYNGAVHCRLHWLLLLLLVAFSPLSSLLL